MIEMTEQKLLDLKKKIDMTKANVSELKGKQTYLKKQLQDLYSVNDVKEASKILKGMEQEINKLNDAIKAHITDLKEKYNV